MTNQKRGEAEKFYASRGILKKRKGRSRPPRAGAEPERESLSPNPKPPSPPRRDGPPGAQRLNPCVLALQELRKAVLAYPGTYEDPAGGRTYIKLKNKKVVAILGNARGGLMLACHLPRTGRAALSLPFAKPTGYGLGKSAWVTAQFEPGETVPLRTLLAWIAESHAALAPPPRRPRK